jgi:3',5'-cyclic AMP phosphodiesterase CpdA
LTDEKSKLDQNADSPTSVDRRSVLKCGAWIGTGVLWGISGGVPYSIGMLGEAEAATAPAGPTFIQLSDSHIGFDKAANPDALKTLTETVDKINGMKAKPSFMLHTGDITHLSKPKQFDDAAQNIGSTKIETFYIPGEHDLVDDDNGKAYLDRYGKGTQGAGYYSFDKDGVHFVGLVNVVNLKAGGLGNLGEEQLVWLANDLKSRKSSQPIVVFAHIPLWTVYADWGWGTEDGAQALALLQRFGSVTVLNGHIHQIIQKVEGNITFHTARSTAFPQPVAGTAPSPGPQVVPADQLRDYLGITSVTVKHGTKALALTDTQLSHL